MLLFVSAIVVVLVNVVVVAAFWCF
jgi:hypothetical protein